MARPSLYKKEFCEKVIRHMAKGFSFESFAGTIGVHKDTLWEWAKVNKEFSDAKGIGFEKSRIFWERIGINMAKTNKGNATSFVFNMKNRFPGEWREKIEREDTVKMAIEWNEHKTYEVKPETDQGD